LKLKTINEEVLYVDRDIVTIDRGQVEFLKEESQKTERQRIRLCAHVNVEDRLHEMIIVHRENTYVRPHKHLSKSESFHIIEGSVDVILFDEFGEIVEIIQMGEFASGKNFYYRISSSTFHTLLIKSDFLVFHETTSGPFNRSDTIFASWSPSEEERSCVAQFVSDLRGRVNSILNV
jgi:cupin fold WbuC family metalloprotein